MAKHLQSIDNQVISRIKAQGPGWVFTPRNLRDLGSHSAVSLALLRYKRAKVITQIGRGLYLFPGRDPNIGALAASTDAIAQALRDRDGARIQPSGAHAANLLGLSEQVPVRAVYLTDGRSRTVEVGRRQIVLKHTTPRNMATAGRISGTVIQALKWIGQRHVDQKAFATFKRKLSDQDKQQLMQDLHYAPAWIADVMRKVATQARK